MLSNNTVCTTPICREMSSRILSIMSPNYQKINPCKNWDRYVCEGYRLSHQVPPHKRQIGVLSTMTDDANSILRDILTSREPYITVQASKNNSNQHEHGGKSDDPSRLNEEEAYSQNSHLVRSYYDACLSDFEVQQLGHWPIRRFLDQIFKFSDGLQIPRAYADDFNSIEDIGVIGEAMKRLTAYGMSAFVQFGPSQSLLNSTETKVILGPHMSPGMPVPNMYRNKNVMNRYADAVYEFFLHTRGPHLGRQEDLRMTAGAVIELDALLASRLPKPELRQDLQGPGNVINLPLEELPKMMPNLPLKEILLSHLPPDSDSISTVEVLFPKHLYALGASLRTMPRTTILAYIQWQAFLQTQDLWHAPWFRDWQSFQRELHGRESEPELWETCLARVKGQFGYILDSLYIRKQMSRRSKDIANDIMENLKKQYVSLFQNTTWLSVSARTVLQKKTNAIHSALGYTEQNPNVSSALSVARYYEGVELRYIGGNMDSHQGHTDDYLNIENWRFRQSWNELARPPDHHKWLTQATTTHSYYSPRQNTLAFPAAMLQLPLFDPELPSAINYGAYGSIAAHEISHAFDAQGRHYGEDGQLGSNSWLSSEQKAFEKHSKCFKEKYDETRVQDSTGKKRKLRGGLVVGEVIADTQGANIAYAAWRAQEGTQPYEMLPELEGLTPDKLFWIMRSLPFCSVEKPSFLGDQIQVDPHPPQSARTWAPLRDSAEWHKTFQCKVEKPVCKMYGWDRYQKDTHFGEERVFWGNEVKWRVPSWVDEV